ncbi:DUF2845 domain-containing protein [Paenibacillus spongiae]|uniref:DUF2845 domain-containing protein n=1 Tax=Paenibacillus spongiae TaxID=2909671 RepID=A0ABY5SFC8_9BACL|nr:DUF2845 domain-containing protein [Paenibacillus spongiae]UVI32672.1 DUF2845 domain-containing protein [Paenibacillus spongiae]
MNDFEPEWYAKLKSGPHKQRTFTAAKMQAIEKEASRITGKQGRKKLRWIPAACACIAVSIVVMGLLPQGSYTGWIRSLIDRTSEPMVPTKPEPAPTPEPPVDDPQPEDDAPLTGYLKDQLPFNTESTALTLSVHDSLNNKDIEIPSERQYVILQNFNWLELEKSKAAELDSAADGLRSDRSVTIRIQENDETYEIPYWPNTNTFEWRGSHFYADSQVLRMMSGLLEPDSQLGRIDRIEEQARMEMEQHGAVNHETVYKSDRLEVNGKDINGWESELMKQQTGRQSGLKYYDDSLRKIADVREMNEDIIAFGGAVFFYSDRYATKGGVKVGLTQAEVLDKLGEPNSKTTSKWSYRIGDYLKFHLYFDQGKVVYISLLLPL